MSEFPEICFDEDTRIRVLPPEQFKQTQELEEECREFVYKMKDFKTTVGTIVEELINLTEGVEKEKLKAIGQRNKLEGEADYRQRQQVALNNLIREKKIELDRYQAKLDSLQHVEAFQKAQIEKLQYS